MLVSIIRQRFVCNSKLKICATLKSCQFSELKDKYSIKILNMESNEKEWIRVSNNYHLLSTIASKLLKEGNFKDLDKLVDKVGLSKCPTGLQTTLLKSYLERKDWEKAKKLYSVSFFIMLFIKLHCHCL